MKKILSAVFVMAMLIITATFAGSVLAADSYQYTHDDGLPVVYVSKTGDVNNSVANPNGKEYTTLNAAVKALEKTGGYVILLEDVEDTVNDVDDPSTNKDSGAASATEKLTGTNGGRSYTFPTTSGKKVIIRGRDDLAEFPKIYLRFMCSIASNSEYAFENVHLNWRKYHKDDNDQSLQCGTSKVTFGIKGNPNSIKVTGMETLTGSKITINGGTFSIRMAKWRSNADVSDVDIVLNGGTLKGITGAHSGPSDKIYGTNCKGDFCITVNGGTYKPSGLGFGQPNNNKFIVGGDYKLTINGGSVTAGTITPVISGKMPKEYKIGGNTIVNILGYTGDKAALASKFKAADWDVIMANEVFVSDAGDDSAAGTADAPVATYAKAVEKLGAAGGVVSVKGTYTMDFYTEAARTATIIITGDTLVLNGDYVMGGSTVFTGVNIKNGTAGAIVAGGNKLSVMADVTTTAAEGVYIDVIAGKRDELVKTDVTILAGRYGNIIATGLAGSRVYVDGSVKTSGVSVVNDVVLNALNITQKATVTGASLVLSEFVDAQAAKFALTGEGVTADAVIATGNINGANQPFVRIEYYLNKKDTDAIAFTPELVIGENVYTAKEAAKAGWNVATFTIADADVFSEVTFRPFGTATDGEVYNKLYVNSIVISQNKDEAPVAYGVPTLASNGDFIPALEDFVLTATELVNTSNLSNVEVKATPFVAGAATQYTPKAATGAKADYFVLKDGAVTSLIGEFYPYVRIEYYAYGRTGEDFGDVYPTLQIGTNVYKATQKLELNKWSIATFQIGNIADPFQEFSFMPYGEASGLNEWNKLYVQKMAFSQTEDLSAAEYGLPDMTENGILVPYVFTPDDGLPVVYYAKGGVYEGEYTGSVDSTTAYGTMAAAVSAINSAGGGYVILCDDWLIEDLSGRNFPKHTNMVIFRGKEGKDGEKIKLQSFYMTNVNGPSAFENLIINWIPAPVSCGDNDSALSANNNRLVIGKKGVENDVVVVNEKNKSDNIMLTGTNMQINSGKFTVRFGGWRYAASTNVVDFEINGGEVVYFNTTHNNTGSVTTTDINLTINGGKFGSKFKGFNNGGKGKVTIAGNVNIDINGGDFSGVGAGAIVPHGTDANVKCAGTRTLDILDYTGDTAALKAKFNLSMFDILNVNAIYLSDDGDDANKGNKAAPVATLARAHELITAGTTETQKYSGKIVISGSGFTVDEVIEEPAHSAPITYNCDGDAALKFESGKFVLGGDVEFKNFNFVNTNSDTAVIEAAGHSLTIADSVKCTAAEGTCIDIIGGKETGTVDSVNVTVNGGEFASIKAGDSVTGNVDITVNGGVICGDIVGGSSVNGGVIGGNTKVVINDGTIEGQVIGGNEAAGATVKGTAYIEVNGGKFVKDAALIATNTNAEAEVTGNAEIKINAGDFTGMNAGNVNAGIGTCGDKICLDYKNYTGDVAALEAAISAASFNVVVERRADKPVFTKADEFVFIIAQYGDPTKALTKSIPFKITQSAAQTSAPVVVSPKQLNLKVDGNDQMIMTLQTVKDTVDTIRLVPNHNFTKGSRMVVEGYNINGRGVDVTKYKYAEIVYYYTVPEGETPAVENMNINFVGKSAGIPSAKSEALVPNKWTTTIIDLNASFEGKTGNLAQYHFDPFGANKKSADVPATQYIDIASLTFYTDKPVTTIQGGNAPNAKIEAEEEAKKEQEEAQKKPTKIEDIVVNVDNLKSTVDNSGAFTSAQVTKDGMTVMEYTPSLDSAKELRIEGYNCMGKAISLNEYQYLTMKILVETKRTDVTFKPAITIQRGGVADNPEAVKCGNVVSETALVPNEWTTVTLKLTPADPAFHITRQFHIAPIGMIKGDTMVEGEKFYLAEFVLSAKPPKAPGAAEEEGEEIIEEEEEVIAESPAIVVDGSSLINSTGDFATFRSSVGEFDGKKVVRIAPAKVDAPVSIDGSALFKETELTPGGAMNLKTHRYAIISYYYETEDTESVKTPEFTLLGGRIQNMDGVVNNVVAKGTAGLKKNEWATAIVKLSGNGAGSLTSGFAFRPFGNVSASNIASGDVLYIENITIVSNRPQ